MARGRRGGNRGASRQVPELLRAMDKAAAEEEEEETDVVPLFVHGTWNGGVWSAPFGPPGM